MTTPGPWRVEPDGTGTGRWFTITGRQDYYDDGSPQEIARTDAYEVRNADIWEPTELAAEIEANAHLLAAAPDLLGAAQATVAMLLCRRWCSHCGYPEDADIKPMPHTNTCYFPALIAAIARATGAPA